MHNLFKCYELHSSRQTLWGEVENCIVAGAAVTINCVAAGAGERAPVTKKLPLSTTVCHTLPSHVLFISIDQSNLVGDAWTDAIAKYYRLESWRWCVRLCSDCTLTNNASTSKTRHFLHLPNSQTQLLHHSTSMPHQHVNLTLKPLSKYSL